MKMSNKGLKNFLSVLKKEEIEKKKKKRMILKIVKVNLGLLWGCCGQCGVSSFSDSSLVWFIFLNIYRPLPM